MGESRLAMLAWMRPVCEVCLVVLAWVRPVGEAHLVMLVWARLKAEAQLVLLSWVRRSFKLLSLCLGHVVFMVIPQDSDRTLARSRCSVTLMFKWIKWFHGVS